MKLLILFPYLNGPVESSVHLAACWPRHLSVALATYADSEPSWLDYKSPEDKVRSAVEEHRPDVVAYVQLPNVPTTDCLAAVRKRCRLVHWCHDAADPELEPVLRCYYERGDVFDLTITTDGAQRGYFDRSMLYPVHPSFYEGSSPKRSHRLGFGGVIGAGGSNRYQVLRRLKPELTHHPADFDSYADYANWLRRCLAVVNVAGCSGNRALQVKGRVVETSLAGCLLLETKGAPTYNWLRLGLDYLEYDSPEDVLNIIDAPDFAEMALHIGRNARERMLELSPHEVFWKAVTDESVVFN